MTELLDTTGLSTRQPGGEKPTTNSGVDQRREADAQPPARRLISLPKLAAIGRELCGPVINYSRLWSACTHGTLPAWRVGALWVVDEQEALEAQPRLFKRPSASSDAA
jgi:hypothetical protein